MESVCPRPTNFFSADPLRLWLRVRVGSVVDDEVADDEDSLEEEVVVVEFGVAAGIGD